VVAIRELLDRGKPTQFIGGDENVGPINNHIRVTFVQPDGTETDDLDKQSNSRRLITRSNPASSHHSVKSIARAEPIIHKVTVEISGADDATRNVIESAIVRALYSITPEPLIVKRVA
jgi:hypothetical protein